MTTAPISAASAAPPSETNAYIAPGANRGDASTEPGTSPGVGAPKNFRGQSYTDYFATPAEAAELPAPAHQRDIGGAWQRALQSLKKSHENAKHLLNRTSSYIPKGVGAQLAANYHQAIHNTTNHGPTNNNSSETHVAAVNVNMPAGSDASAIARDIKPALERTSFAMHANYSLA